MEDIIEYAKLLTKMNINQLEYQQCLIKNQDNIFKLIDRLNEIEQLYYSILHEKESLILQNKELKKQVKQFLKNLVK